MTIQEILAIINKEAERARKNNNKRLIEAYTTVAEILNSRIPAEPVYDEDAELMKTRCPNCHAGLTGFEQFCDACGQAILWNEDSEDSEDNDETCQE